MYSKQKELWLKLWGEPSDPSVLHFLKTSARNEDGMSKDVYKAGGVQTHVCM